MFDVDEDFLLPQVSGDLIPCDHLAMPCDKQRQQFKRLSLQPQHAAIAGELVSAAIKPELAEEIDRAWHQLRS